MKQLKPYRSFLLAALLLVMFCPVFSQKGVVSPALKGILNRIDSFNKKMSGGEKFPTGIYTEESYQKRYAFNKSLKAALLKVDGQQLDFNDWISWQLLLFTVDDNIQEYELKRYLNPLLSDEGFHIDFSGYATGHYSDKKSLIHYIHILNDFPRFVNEYFALMRSGLKQGISQPALIIEGLSATYNTHIVEEARKSFFFPPFQTKPALVAQKDWDSIVIAGTEAINKNVIPQFRRIKEFFEGEYIPQTRKSLGVSHYPNGLQYYQQRVNYFTTLHLSYDSIYNIGMKEVDRIQKDMESVMKEVGFSGTLKEFIQQLRSDPKFYATTPEGLLKEASFIAKKIDGRLPEFFGRLPRQPYTVEPVPDFLAPNYTGGRYSGAPIKSTRPGAFWVNTYQLESRPLYVLESLALHEAVPGHHLQISLSQESENLPDFRRNLYVNAFGEGWALYGEYLGTEMGFYKDPYTRFGRLTYEMWRACRLVIDVGLHAKDWTRQQAVDFLADHTALSLHEVNTEINRYIAWPGQALSYKMGELKIRELRTKAENELKGKFDIRAFHDMILSRGTVTLSILEKMTDQFIAEQKKK